MLRESGCHRQHSSLPKVMHMQPSQDGATMCTDTCLDFLVTWVQPYAKAFSVRHCIAADRTALSSGRHFGNHAVNISVITAQN